MCWLLSLFVVNLIGFFVVNGLNVQRKYQWVNLEYDYASSQARQDAIDAGKFVPGISRLFDVDVYYGENNDRKIFVTSPRIAVGIPVTISTITNKLYNNSHILAPYPSWAWHENLLHCPRNRIVSVFRIKIDECQRLWILDTGSSSSGVKCPPQLLAFDVKTDKLIHRYEIPASQVQSNSIFNLPIVDVRNYETCNNTFVYAMDTRGFALIVHDVDNQQSWRITDKTFHASPDFGTVCINGAQYDLMDGIHGSALSPYIAGEDRVLFYQSFASNSQQWVWTSKIRNRTAFLDGTRPNPKIFHIYCGRRDTQISPMAIDRRGIAYFGMMKHTSLNCWNTAAPYGMNHIRELHRSPNIQYINGLKLVIDRNGFEELWFLNTRARRAVSGPSNDNIVNFRIHTVKVEGLYKRCSGKWTGFDPYEYWGGCKFMSSPCNECFNANKSCVSDLRKTAKIVTKIAQLGIKINID